MRGGRASGGEGAVSGVRPPAEVEECVQRLDRPAVGPLPKPGAQEPAAVCPDLPVNPRLRVDVAVDNDRAHSLRKQVGVGGAEEAAVGDPPITQPAIADRGAQQVKIPGGVGGGDVTKEAAIT